MAMDFKSAGQRVRTLLAPKKPAELSRSALTPDPLRDNIIREAEGQSPRFQRAIDHAPRIEYERTHEDGTTSSEEYIWDSFPDAMRDFARAAFGWDEPEVLSPDKVRPSSRFNRTMMQAAISSQDFQELRPYARNNETEALYGAMIGADALKEQAPERLAEHIARSEQMAEQEQAVDDAESMFERLRQRARQEISEQGAVQPDTRREIKQALKQGQQAGANLEQLMQDEAASGMAVDAIAAGRAMAEKAQQAIELFGSVPGVGGGHAHNRTPDQQIELAEKWTANEQLRKIVRGLGRMIRSMRFSREARTKNVQIEPVGITTGRDLRLQLPHEMARAMSNNPLVKATWVRDFASSSLLQYDMTGKVPAGKGPIITVHDGSGSMSGEKFVWATSLCLSVLTIAQREKRDFAACEFGSRGQLKSWHFPKNEPADPDQVLDYATHFFNGGTSTLTGMQEALRVMREHEQFRSADVLLVADGQDRFGDEDKKVRDELRALGARIHGLSILCPNNAYMKQMCDYVVDVQDLAGPNDATDAVAQNIT